MNVDTVDIVIVGGGIVGSAVAYFLSTDAAGAGRRIVLIERDTSYRQGSTARSAGAHRDCGRAAANGRDPQGADSSLIAGRPRRCRHRRRRAMLDAAHRRHRDNAHAIAR